MKKQSFVLTILFILLIICGCTSTSSKSSDLDNTIIRNHPSILETALEIAVPEIDFDKVVIKDDLLKNSNGNVVRSFSETYLLSDIKTENNNLIITHDYQYYGLHQLSYLFYKDGIIVKEIVEENTITSKEYNVAALIATMPVTDYTLMALNQDYASTYFDSSIPSIIFLERAWSYTWNELPENMVINPFISDEVIIQGDNNKHYKKEFSKHYDYIAYLYSLDNSSKFNFYINDYWPNQFLEYMKIGIPVEQMKFIFISDGTATFNVFKNAYGDMSADNDNSLEVYEQITEDWNAFKTTILEDRDKGNKALKASGRRYVRDFIQPMLLDDDFDVFWLVNNNSDNNYNGLRAFKEIIKVNPKFVKLDMNSLLKELSESEKYSLSKLYSFDNTELKKALAEGKQPVIFLGTSTSNETYLSSFCTIMKNLLGDDYAVLYKGHPGHITNGSENREKILSDNGYIMLDASIPAELVAFFNPESYLAGYPTSTFLTIDTPIPFMCFNQYDSSFINNVMNYAEVLSDGTFRIVKDRMTNPQNAIWDGISDWSSLVWADGDPNNLQ